MDKRCGTCDFLVGVLQSGLGGCVWPRGPLPAWAFPKVFKIMHVDEGADCECWKKKGGEGMTPTEAAIARLRELLWLHREQHGSFVTIDPPDLRLLLAERDRYEKALMEIDDLIDGITTLTHQIKKLVQEALRCESSL